jgi:hypothetical protein
VKNCTVPVIVPGVPEVTEALNVTEVPASCGLPGNAVRTVVVAFRGFTVYETGSLVEVAKLPPEVGVKTAVSESGLPIGRPVVVSEAEPALRVCGLPMPVVPLLN